MSVLIALYVTQPATPTLIAVTCDTAISAINTALIKLWRCGLMTRKKSEGTRYGGGRRPWIYELSPNGYPIAEYLTKANERLHYAIEGHDRILFGDKSLNCK